MLAITLFAALSVGAAPPPTLHHSDQIFIDLDDDEFDVRQKADARLKTFTRAGCENAVRHHLKHKDASPEVRWRLAKYAEKWSKEDWVYAEKAFDEMFPKPEDVPEIDGAYYDPANRSYSAHKAAYATMRPWLAASGYDHQRFGGVGWVQYRTAMRWWGVAMLHRGEDREKVREAVLWIRARDDVFLGRSTPDFATATKLNEQPPPALLLKAVKPYCP
jgi:hypothetical protein